MPKFYDMGNMTQEHLNEIALERNTFAKEIERLNKRVKECEEAYLRTRHQYSELENKYLTDEHIINELEKWLNEEQVIYRDYLIRTPKFDSDYGANHLTLSNLTKVLEKLQELKGDSSNGQIH